MASTRIDSSLLALWACLTLLTASATLALSCGPKAEAMPTPDGLFGEWLSSDGLTLTFFEDMTGISDYRELEAVEQSRFTWHLGDDRLFVYYESRYAVTFDTLSMTLVDAYGKRTDFLCRETSKLGSIVAVWQAIDPASEDPEYMEGEEAEPIL